MEALTNQQTNNLLSKKSLTEAYTNVSILLLNMSIEYDNFS